MMVLSCGPTDRENSEEGLEVESEDWYEDELSEFDEELLSEYDYNYLIMLEDDASLTMDDLSDALEKVFSETDYVEATVERDGNDILVKKNAWVMTLVHEEGEEVLSESKELADEFAYERSDYDAIAACSRRLVVFEEEVSDDDFNESLEVIHCISNFEKTHIFDALLGEVSDDL